MKKSLFVIFLVFFVLGMPKSFAQTISFSDSTTVSLITCSPGEEVYAKFGHSAIRINDEINNIDIVFNYGIFDFNTHNFYYKFVKGETDYKLEVYDFYRFIPEYIDRNSYVWEQKLNLTQEEKEELIELLLINYRPENQYYRYNFIYDNCSTRPRDIILKAIDGRVNYNHPAPDKTFREWVQMYVGRETWVMFGIDMIFGKESDQIANRRESMFLPEVLMNEFNDADIIFADGEESRPLISEYIILNQKEPEKEKKQSFILSPTFVLSILLVIGILLFIFRHTLRIPAKIFDTLLYSIVGLIGLVAFYLCFISLHPMVGENFNILWLNPLFIIVAITQWFRKLRDFTFYLLIVNVVMIFSSLFVYALSIQHLNIAYIPLILLLLVRSLTFIRHRFKQKRAKSKYYGK